MAPNPTEQDLLELESSIHSAELIRAENTFAATVFVGLVVILILLAGCLLAPLWGWFGWMAIVGAMGFMCGVGWMLLRKNRRGR